MQTKVQITRLHIFKFASTQLNRWIRLLQASNQDQVTQTKLIAYEAILILSKINMKTCYLHLGFHKTATTSFQLSCGNNREKLLEEGIYYPKFEYKERKGNRWNHSGNIRFLCQTKTRRKLPKKKLLNQIEFKKALKRSDNLLLSGEGFSCMKREELEILKKY